MGKVCTQFMKMMKICHRILVIMQSFVTFLDVPLELRKNYSLCFFFFTFFTYISHGHTY